jgi:hypothetical protein
LLYASPQLMFLGDPSLCADRGFIETVLKAGPLGT